MALSTSPKAMIQRSINKSVTYSSTVGGYIRPEQLLMKPIISQVQDNLYYAYITDSINGLMLVEFTMELSTKLLKVTKILPMFISPSTTMANINTPGQANNALAATNIYVSLNGTYITVHLISSNQAYVIDIIQNTVIQNITLPSSVFPTYVTYVYYDHDYNYIYFVSNSGATQPLYGINCSDSSLHTLIANLFSDTDLTTNISNSPTYYTSYNNFAMAYDSVKKVFAINMILVSNVVLPTASAYGYLSFYSRVKFFSIASNQTLTPGQIVTYNQSNMISTIALGTSTWSGWQYSAYTNYVDTVLIDEKSSVIQFRRGTGIRYTIGSTYNTLLNTDMSVSYKNISSPKYYGSSGRTFVDQVGSDIASAWDYPYATVHLLGVNGDSDLLIMRTTAPFGGRVVSGLGGTSEIGIARQGSSYIMLEYLYQAAARTTKEKGGYGKPFTQFSELDKNGIYPLYSRQLSTYSVQGYVAGAVRTSNAVTIATDSTSYPAIYTISASSYDSSLMPTNGVFLEPYDPSNKGIYSVGNAEPVELHNVLSSVGVLYHEYYEHLKTDLFLVNNSGIIQVILYRRDIKTIRTINTVLQYSPSTVTYDAGLCRDGSNVVFIKYTLLSPYTVEYFVSNQDMTGLQSNSYLVTSTSYALNSSKSAEQIAHPEYSPVLFTEKGVSMLGALSDTPTFTSVPSDSQVVYHKGTYNTFINRATLKLDSTGNIVVSGCSITRSSYGGTTGRTEVLKPVVIQNKYRIGDMKYVTGGSSTSSGSITKSYNVPIIGQTDTQAIIITHQTYVTNISGRFDLSTSFTSPFTSARSASTYRLIYLTVTGISGQFPLFPDYMYSSTETLDQTTSPQWTDIVPMSIKFLNANKTVYVLKGCFLTTDDSSYYSNSGELYFALKVDASAGSTNQVTEMYILPQEELDPFEINNSKVVATSWLGAGRDSSYQTYYYNSSPVSINLESQYPDKDVYYKPDSIDYKVNISDPDSSGMGLDEVKLLINNEEVETKTDGLSIGEPIDFLVNIQSLLDSTVLHDGNNDVQFQLISSGEISSVVNLTITKGKMYRLEEAPDIHPTTVITKAHLKSYNGDDELTPLSGVKTQSASGDVEYVYHYSKEYAGAIRDLVLKMTGSKADNDTVEINKIIAVFEGGEN